MLLDLIETYTDKWVGEAIKEAVAVGGGRNIKYITAILQRWQNQGFKENIHGDTKSIPKKEYGEII